MMGFAHANRILGKIMSDEKETSTSDNGEAQTSKSSRLQFDREALSLIDDHEEEVSVDGKTELKSGIYLLPNLFTTAALFSGFFAIISAMHGNFANAAIAIYAAMIFDGLDGRVARLMNAQSKFGAEYDSLADMVSFGVAPALVVFSWALGDLGKFGWAAVSYTHLTQPTNREV